MNKEPKFVKFSYDVITGDHRGHIDNLTGAQKHQAALHLYKYGSKNYPYREPVLDLIKRLDEVLWEKALHHWPEPAPRVDSAELAAFREKILGAAPYNPALDY